MSLDILNTGSRRRSVAVAAIAACLQFAVPVWAGNSVGVVPFERHGPEGSRVIDVAPRLAQRLGAAGLDRVVGPAELGARRTARPTPEEIEAWAGGASVEYLVIGHVTRFGTSLSVDARLLDALTGLEYGEPAVAEVANPDDLARALDGIAKNLSAQLAPADAASSGTDDKPRSGPSADEPIEITSDELSFQPGPGGGRTMDFEGHVKILKGALTVNADVARASYPPGESSPDEIAARGHVVIQQEGKTAYCERADFDQVANQMVCTGNLALLEQGCDRVRGKKITFSLGTEELQVEGNVEVKRVPGCEEAG